MTIARIAALHRLPVGPFSLSTTPVPPRKPRDRHELHPFVQSHTLRLPSAASPRSTSLSSFASTHAPLRNRCVLLGEQADRSGFAIRRKSKPHSSRQVTFQHKVFDGRNRKLLWPNPGKRHRQRKTKAFNRRDQRAVCSTPRPAGRPRPPSRRSPFHYANCALVTSGIGRVAAKAAASVCGPAAGVALRLRCAMRFPPLSAPLPARDRRPKPIRSFSPCQVTFLDLAHQNRPRAFDFKGQLRFRR